MVAALWALVAVLAAGGVVGVLTQWLRAESLLTAAQNASRDAQLAQAKEATALDRQRIIRAYDEWMSDNAQAARDLLRDTAGRKETWEWRYINRLCHLGRFVFDDHQSGVSGLAYTRDGRYLISVGRDGALIMRDLVDGTSDRLTIPPNRPDDLSSLSICPKEDRYLAVGANSGMVYIWDVQSRRIAASWQAHERATGNTSLLVSLSPDGRYLATGLGRTAKVWDLEQVLAAGDADPSSVKPPKVVSQMAALANLIRICWSPDDRCVAGCSFGRDNIRVWPAASGGEGERITTISWQANCVAYSPDNRYFAWSGLDSVVALHDAVTLKRVATLSGTPGYQACLTFSPDGRFVAGGSASGPVRIWDLKTNQMVATLHGHSSGVRELAFSPDGSQLATAGTDQRVIVWDFMDQQDVTMLQPMVPGRLFALAFSADSRRMVTSIRDFRLWDLDSRGQRLVRALGESAGMGISAAFHPAGERFAGGNSAGNVHVFSAAGAPLANHNMKGLPLALQYVDDGRRLVVAGWENALYSWDPESNEEPVRLLGPLGKSPARLDNCQAAFGPDGRWLAYAERREPLTIWNVQTRTVAHSVDDTPPSVTALASDRTGRFLAIGGDKGEILIHDVTTAHTVAKWNGHFLGITGLSFTPDGTRLASASRDGNFKLWDTATADEVLTLRGHATLDATLAFSPDGHVCVAGGWDGYLRVWSIKSPPNDSPETWLARRRSWHQRHADVAVRDQSWFRAAHHFGQLAVLQPQQWRYSMSRGRSFTEFGQWESAAVAYDAAISNPNCSPSPYIERALVYLRAGDGEGHRRWLERMWDVWSKRPDIASHNALVWACVLTPNSPIPADRIVALLEESLAGTNSQSRRDVLHTLGAALHRAGRYPEALARLDESLRLEEKNGLLEDWVFLALVHHRLGQLEKARDYLTRADKEMEHIRATKSRTGGNPLPWRTRTEIELLYKELKTVLAD
jgi:WD40 repeat protein